MSSNSNCLIDTIAEEITTATGAGNLRVLEVLQELWSGYGSIVRIGLSGASAETAILKLINAPQNTPSQHPRGWNTSDSHQRKIRSYEVEAHWYQHYASLCGTASKVPSVIHSGIDASRQWILMEDLTVRYPRLASSLTMQQAHVCLQWLAAFHAKFLHCQPEGLWPVGTYWHLATRKDELSAMPAGQLKDNAAALDAKLNNSAFQTIVHGDAKVANFCFAQNMDAVAAVDFQYVGGGVGIKDVAYFLGSCFDEDTLEQNETELLSVYFQTLNTAVAKQHGTGVADDVVQDWSGLYAIAWTDFYRFLEGWMPGHKKINRYTRLLAERAFEQLNAPIDDPGNRS